MFRFSVYSVYVKLDPNDVNYNCSRAQHNDVKEAIEKQKRRKQMLKDISQYGILIILAVTVAVTPDSTDSVSPLTKPVAVKPAAV